MPERLSCHRAVRQTMDSLCCPADIDAAAVTSETAKGAHLPCPGLLEPGRPIHSVCRVRLRRSILAFCPWRRPRATRTESPAEGVAFVAVCSAPDALVRQGRTLVRRRRGTARAD